MLDTGASYHCMQFQEKLMNQTSEDGKKTSFGILTQIWAAKNWLRQSLDVMVSYHHAQYLKKLMRQSWENHGGIKEKQTQLWKTTMFRQLVFSTTES